MVCIFRVTEKSDRQLMVNMNSGTLFTMLTNMVGFRQDGFTYLIPFFAIWPSYTTPPLMIQLTSHSPTQCLPVCDGLRRWFLLRFGLTCTRCNAPCSYFRVLPRLFYGFGKMLEKRWVCLSPYPQTSLSACNRLWFPWVNTCWHTFIIALSLLESKKSGSIESLGECQ